MKNVMLLISLVLFTLTATAKDKIKYLLQNESIDDVQIFSSFNLRANDGSVKSFYPTAVKDEHALENLPAEKGADYSLCESGKLNVDLFLKLTDISLRLTEEIMENRIGQLTAQDIAVIQKVPRCEPYKGMLISVANFLAMSTSPATDDIKDLNVVKINDITHVELKTKSGSSILFRTAVEPKKIKKISDLANISVRTESSGQNLSLQVSFLDSNYDQSPTRNHRTEACTVTETVTECDPHGTACKTRTITRSGTRYIDSETSFDSTTYEIKLIDLQNRVVFSGKVMDGDFNSSTRNTSPCYAN